MTTKLTYAAERLAATGQLKSPLDAYAKRADRLAKGALSEVYGRLKRGEKITDSPVYAELDWKDSMLARGLRLGVEEFKKNHPRLAGELEETIAHQRECRRNYVVSGLRADLPDRVYLGILGEIGIPDALAEQTLESIRDVAALLDEKTERRMLVE